MYLFMRNNILPGVLVRISAAINPLIDEEDIESMF